MKSDADIEYERFVLAELIGPTRAGWYAESCLVEYGDYSEAALWKCRYREMAMAAGQLVGERNAYASEALTALAGAVATPEKGYVEDGGHGLMTSDIRRLRKQRDALMGVADRMRLTLHDLCREESTRAGIAELLDEAEELIAMAKGGGS